MKIKSIKTNNRHIRPQAGFAMLFTVLIVTLILSISISISNLSFKQTVLSSLAKDSQISFYQADTAIECGLYYDTTVNLFPLGTNDYPTEQIFCGNETYNIDASQSFTDYFVYKQAVNDNSNPCSTIVFDKSTTLGTSIVGGFGYNICGASVRQVERALEVRY